VAAQERRSDTASRALDIAEELTQTRGFNGFSYADIAARLGVTKAALHFHFRTKADLGEALVARYTERFLAALADIDATVPSSRNRLGAYVELYRNVLEANRMCLCGMLAAEQATLPEPMRRGIQEFFEANERWLTTTITAGRDAGALHGSTDAADAGRWFVGALEGSMMLARLLQDRAAFDRTASMLLEAVA
jgi:TetR/AcrR family transcriptional repressor of nem operon